MSVRHPLRILLGNADMEYPGGTQAWIREMAAALAPYGEVFVATAQGEVPPDLRGFDPELFYDLALINHWATAQRLRRARIGFRIHISHGVIPFEEIPVLGADAYVAVSEDVQRGRIPWRSTVIRNPLDLQRFHPGSRRLPEDGPRSIAFVSNRQGKARPIVEGTATVLGVPLRVVGRETAVADTAPVYREADLVIGIARVAMEALVSGAEVLCFDYQGLHGMASARNLEQLRASNFGGHRAGTWPTVQELAALIRRDYGTCAPVARVLRAEQDPRVIAEQHLELYRTRRPSFWARCVRRGPRQLMSPKVTLALLAVKGWAARLSRARTPRTP